MNKKIYWCVLIVLLGCSGCKHHKHQVVHDTLRVGLGNEPDTLDPQLSQDLSATRVLFDLFAGLEDFSQDGKIIPGLASSYEVSADGKTYTFHLRNKLKFSNGLPITANDFVYSWRRLVDPKLDSPYSFLLFDVVNAEKINLNKLPPETLGVSAPNPLTFVVKLDHPDSNFIRYCARPNLMVVPEIVIARYGKNWTNPQHMVTSGAYKLAGHVVDGYILLEKSPLFFEAKSVKIDKVRFIPYVDIYTELNAYKAGDIDISAVPGDSIAKLGKKHANELHIVPQEGIYFLDYNLRMPLFANNLKLRQALSMAVDRDELVKEVLHQEQKPLYGVASSTIDAGQYANIHYAWESWSADYRHHMAKVLYDAATANYGKAFPVITLNYNTSELNKSVALAVASMWEKNLGIKVGLNNQGFNLFYNNRRDGNFMLTRDAWLPDYDSVSAYTILYACKSPQNFSGYCNSQYDQLTDNATLATNQDMAHDLYSQALTIALNDYPIIPLFEYTYVRLVKPYVHGYNPEVNHFDHVQSKWLYLTN